MSPRVDRDRSTIEPEAFAWPPVETDKQEPPPTPHTPHTPARRAPIQIRLPNRLLESIETTLLGRTSLAFDRWAQRTGWVRDTQDAYCWRCGGSIGPHESDGEGCATCRVKALPWDRAIRLGRHQGLLRDEVLALKFSRWRATGIGLGEHLGLAIGQQLKDAQLKPEQAVLVPIPMHRVRRLTRGIDHTAVLATAAARSSGCQIRRLLKARYRPEQVGLSMTARAKNIKDAFYFASGANGRSRRRASLKSVYILIDDVRTTGATFVAGTRALKTGICEPEKTNTGGNTVEIAHHEIWVASIGVAGESRRGIVEAQ